MFVHRIALALTFLVVAAGARADDEPVLHEYIPEASDGDLDFVLGSDNLPSAILYDGELLAAPTGGPRRANERAMTARQGAAGGPSGVAGRRSPSFRPDRVTSLDGQVPYYDTFTPRIAPYKRTTSLDAVRLEGGVPVLYTRGLERIPVPVGGPAAGDEARDRFWGNVLLDFSSGPRVPFPSVSPESQLLSVRTEPNVALQFFRDGSGNFEALSERSAGEVRVVFLTDAPRDFFNAPAIPNVASDVLEVAAPTLPARVERDALQFASELGLERSASLPEVLATLTAHFRSFIESDEPPPNTGNIYLDLARSGRGICRHRAYAFMLTSLAFGIPTRFVHNEAHAWVEVQLPEINWMRIDLGGALGGLSPGLSSEPRYRSHHADPLPRPPAYAAALRGTSAPIIPNATSTDPNVSGPGESEGEGAVAVEQAPGPGARPVRLRLDEEGYSALRGRSVAISGRATDPEGGGVAGLRIEVLLRAQGERLLGVTVTTDSGAFAASLGLPLDLPLGDYELVVRTPGNEDFLPAAVR